MSSGDFSAGRSRPQTGVFEIETCVVEVAGETVGLVTAEDRGLVFHAASIETWPIDRCSFSCRASLDQAVRELLRTKSRTARNARKCCR